MKSRTTTISLAVTLTTGLVLSTGTIAKQLMALLNGMFK